MSRSKGSTETHDRLTRSSVASERLQRSSRRVVCVQKKKSKELASHFKLQLAAAVADVNSWVVTAINNNIPSDIRYSHIEVLFWSVQLRNDLKGSIRDFYHLLKGEKWLQVVGGPTLVEIILKPEFYSILIRYLGDSSAATKTTKQKLLLEGDG